MATNILSTYPAARRTNVARNILASVFSCPITWALASAAMWAPFLMYFVS
jgi:hypothetical protein